MNATTDNAPTRKTMLIEDVRRGITTDSLISKRAKILASATIAKKTINPARFDNNFYSEDWVLNCLLLVCF